jgi:hypothetical protein
MNKKMDELDDSDYILICFIIGFMLGVLVMGVFASFIKDAVCYSYTQENQILGNAICKSQADNLEFVKLDKDTGVVTCNETIKTNPDEWVGNVDELTVVKTRQD